MKLTQKKVYESVYIWNYRVQSPRLITRTTRDRSFCLFTHDEFITLVNSTRAWIDPWHLPNQINSFSVYRAKNLKRCLTSAENNCINPFSDFYDYYQPPIVFHSQIKEGASNRLCLTLGGSGFDLISILDFNQRKLSSKSLDEMCVRDTTIAVYPADMRIPQFFKKMKKFNRNGFTVVQKDKERIEKVTGNQLKILHKSNLLVKINHERDGDVLLVSLDIYARNERTPFGGVDKKGAGYFFAQKISFFLPNFGKIETRPFTGRKGRTNSQCYQENLHIVNSIIQNSNSYKGLDIVCKEVDLRTLQLKKVSLYSQSVDPNSGCEFQEIQRSSYEAWSEVGYSQSPKSEYLILVQLVVNETKNEEYFRFLIRHLPTNRIVVWRAGTNLCQNRVSFGKNFKVFEDVNGILLMSDATSTFYQIPAALSFQYLNLQNLFVQSIFVKLKKEEYSRISGVVAIIKRQRTKRQNSLDSQDSSNKNIELLLELKRPEQSSLNKNSMELFCGGLTNKTRNHPLNNRLLSLKTRFHKNFKKNEKTVPIFKLIDKELFCFIFSLGQSSILIRRFGEDDLEEIENDWKVGLKQIPETEFVLSSRFKLNKKTGKTDPRFEVVRSERRIDEKHGEVVEMRVLISKIVENRRCGYKKSFIKKDVNLVVDLTLYFDQPTRDFSGSGDGLGGLGYELQYDYFYSPRYPGKAVNRGLMGKERSLVEVVDNIYIDVKKNEIYERNFEGELMNLYRMAACVTEETVVDLLVRFVSLGGRYIDLVKQLGIKGILDLLKEAGWEEGARYYQVEFEQIE